MPWCGYWGTTGGAFWWVLPLIGLVVMAVMFLVCVRHFGCKGRCRRGSRELSTLESEVKTLKQDVQKLVRQPN